ncbi:hypothetical protein CVT24_004863 [Panaeolus cyanescens]|uniref:DUF6533 domain-containing protein n=1 Tax=Panaeolus cyanescens TaxID=181874 RepID=A0A409V9W1_9AGAR|nr:hypothetical protein CVT24_004863 [Panaeolus cyanescens]
MDSDIVKDYKLSLIPLYMNTSFLVLVLHDYFVTLEDEMTYIWTQRRSFAKYMFFWIRYYTILLLVFEACQVHLLAQPAFATEKFRCAVIDPLSQVLGIINIWAADVILLLRIYAFFQCSRKACHTSALLSSIGAFLYILAVNITERGSSLASPYDIRIPGCPVMRDGIEWAQWLPVKVRMPSTLMVYLSMLISDLQGVGGLPWLGFGPLHACVGIGAARLLIQVPKFSKLTLEDGFTKAAFVSELRFLTRPCEPEDSLFVGAPSCSDGPGQSTTMVQRDVERNQPEISTERRTCHKPREDKGDPRETSSIFSESSGKGVCLLKRTVFRLMGRRLDP